MAMFGKCKRLEGMMMMSLQRLVKVLGRRSPLAWHVICLSSPSQSGNFECCRSSSPPISPAMPLLVRGDRISSTNDDDANRASGYVTDPTQQIRGLSPMHDSGTGSSLGM